MAYAGYHSRRTRSQRHREGARETNVDDKEHLNQVNAHVLNAILDAGQDRAIVASRDIYDERGVKLLAQNKQITHVLQQRLLERRLKVPLEASLRFEVGVDKIQLRRAFTQLLDSGHGLVRPLRPWAKAVDLQVTSLPLEPVAQFLLTTVQTMPSTPWRWPVPWRHAMGRTRRTCAWP